MTRAFLIQTNFTAGELDLRLFGRTDLRAYENGAGRLRNVVVETTGGVVRRPGMAYVATAPGPGRLVAMEVGGGFAYVLVFTEFQIDIYRGGVLRDTVTAPWSLAELADISWAQFGQSLIIAHPDIPLQRLKRESDTSWTLDDLEFALTGSLSHQPFAKFADPDVTLTSSATSGTVTLTTSAAHFNADHLGVVFRLQGKQVLITNILTTTTALGLALETLTSTGPSRSWDEQAFSAARGWPVAVSFHQDRMVLGGSRDLQNGLWLSRTGDPFNFDLGTGLDDEGIAFRVAASDVPAIRALVAGRHLQVFTSQGEWIVTGDPLTPTNIQLRQQSRIGSLVDRQVPPRDVDGATLFAARSGREIREFVFTDTEQAYQAPDLALLARHLVVDPVDQDFDRERRLFLIALADGGLACIGIYRNADIVAWSRLETDGDVLSVAVADGATQLLVQRSTGVFLERLQDDLYVDSGKILIAMSPATVWTGLGHLSGKTVRLVADDEVVGDAVVSGGQVTLAEPASTLMVGLPFEHLIEPLPLSPGLVRGTPQDALYRPVRVTLRLRETRSLAIDTGNGLEEVMLDPSGGPTPAPFTGDHALRALGWRRGMTELPWRIQQDAPRAFALMSVTTELKVNS
jgi:hypothetical protein